MEPVSRTEDTGHVDVPALRVAVPEHDHRTALVLPAGSLVVLAGLPGVGKTTLLRRLSSRPGVQALDAEDVARRLVRLPVPYRVLRPFVHVTHLLTVLAALVSSTACVLTTDPMTSPLRRRSFRLAARLTGRHLHVVLLHATPAQARDGQRQRGRTLGRRRTARHERRYAALAAGPVDVVLTREQASRVVPARPRLHLVRPGAAPDGRGRLCR